MRTLHLGLRVADVERSLAFYTSLGYEVLGEVPSTGFGRLTMLKLPDDEFVSLELVHYPSAGAVDPSGFSHLVIKVEAIHDSVSRLASAGIEADGPTSPDGSDDFWTCLLSDRTAIASSSSSGPPATLTECRGANLRRPAHPR